MNYIYCFTNLINGKKYIGSTIHTPESRYKQHIYNATHENAHQYNYPLYQAIRKYGIDNFKFESLFEKECDEEEIREIEAEYIKKYNCVSPNGYNQTYDTTHPINDPLTYEKIRTTKRENAKEVAMIDDDLQVINTWRSIVDCAEETGLDDRKIAAVCRGDRKTTQGYRFAWVVDGELIIPEYSRDRYKGDPNTTQKQITNRKVAKIDLVTNEIIDVYDSIALASRQSGCDGSSISKVCNGKRNKCGGFKWQYVDS